MWRCQRRTSAFAAMRRRRSDLARAPGRVGRAVPTIVFHGDRDTTVNPVNGDQVIAQSKASAALRTTVTTGEASGGIRYTCTVQTDENGAIGSGQWVLHGAGPRVVRRRRLQDRIPSHAVPMRVAR